VRRPSRPSEMVDVLAGSASVEVPEVGSGVGFGDGLGEGRGLGDGSAVATGSAGGRVGTADGCAPAPDVPTATGDATGAAGRLSSGSAAEHATVVARRVASSASAPRDGA
jgi:hypothetical protein